MNKYIKYIYIIIGLFYISACQETDYEAPGSFCDVAWTNNVIPGTTTDKNQGDFISFIDLSVNQTSHYWEIEEGNFFLKKGITERDSLPLCIDSSCGLRSTDYEVNILLNKPGINKIRLHNTFKESVRWNGSIPISSKFENGEWVIDTCIQIYVYAKILPKLTVYKDKELTQPVCQVDENQLVELKDSLSWPTIKIEAGEKLYFVDETTHGEPTTRYWEFKGAKISSSADSIATVPFFKLGSFSGFAITAKRELPKPQASVKKYIPLRVEVIKSSQPFESDNTITENEDQTINVYVSGELDKVPTTIYRYFTAHISNPNGYNENVDVVSVVKDSKDLTKLVLKLAKPIFNSDIVTIAYSGPTGEDIITSIDNRILKSFDATPVSMYFKSSVLEQPDQMGFEIEDTYTNGNCDGWWAFNPNNWFRCMNISYKGVASLCCSIEPQGQNFDPWIQSDEGADLPNSMRFKAGSYIIRTHIFIDKDANEDLKLLFSFIANPWTHVEYILTNLPKGEWVTLNSNILSFDKDINTKLVLKINTDAANKHKVLFYLDQFELLPVELRP